jgi:hypothetical protein
MSSEKMKMCFRIELLQNPGIKGLFENRVNKLTEEMEVNINIEGDWKPKDTSQQAAKEKFGDEKEIILKKINRLES